VLEFRSNSSSRIIDRPEIMADTLDECRTSALACLGEDADEPSATGECRSVTMSKYHRHSIENILAPADIANVSGKYSDCDAKDRKKSIGFRLPLMMDHAKLLTGESNNSLSARCDGIRH